MSSRVSRQRKGESQFARNIAALKNEFRLLLGTLDPVSAFNYLHYEGIVSQSEKEDFDHHISVVEPSYRQRSVSTSTHESKKTTGTDIKLQEVAREKLTTIVGQRNNQKELRTIVIALNAFKKLHQPVTERRQTVQGKTTEQDSTFPEQRLRGILRKQEPLPEEKLLAAFEQGTHDTVQLIQLLKENRSKCDISEVRNFEGKTLLHLACCSQPIEIVKALVHEYACDPNIQDNEGNTALHEASRCQKSIVAKFIVNLFNCDPNILNSEKETPILLTLRRQQWRLSKVILKSGKVDKTVQNSHNETAADLIEKHPQNSERVKLMKLLLRNENVYSNESPLLSPTESVDDDGISFDKVVTISVDKDISVESLLTKKAHTLPMMTGSKRPLPSDELHTTLIMDLESSSNNRTSLDFLEKQTRELASIGKCVNICLDFAEIMVKIGYFLIAIVLCLVILILFICFI